MLPAEVVEVPKLNNQVKRQVLAKSTTSYSCSTCIKIYFTEKTMFEFNGVDNINVKVWFRLIQQTFKGETFDK